MICRCDKCREVNNYELTTKNFFLTSLLSTSYLPPISYIAACIQSKKIIIEKHEHYVKQTHRNRTLIYGANGILPLIIPVQHENLFSIPIHEVKIAHDTKWQKIHWRSVVSSYRNSAFFEYFEDDFAGLYQQKAETLFEFNLRLLELIFRFLKAEVEISFTSSYQKEVLDMPDLRNTFDTTNPPIPSKNRYRQVFSAKHGFISNLSVIDLLFNEGPESIFFLR